VPGNKAAGGGGGGGGGVLAVNEDAETCCGPHDGDDDSEPGTSEAAGPARSSEVWADAPGERPPSAKEGTRGASRKGSSPAHRKASATGGAAACV